MSYGRCPTCGEPGVTRERSINGNTICKNGHRHPHASFDRHQAAAAVSAALKPEIDKMQRIAVELWRLLDDIDTLDDMAKSDNAGFRRLARGIQRRRFELLTSEDWDRLEKQCRVI